MPRLPRLRVDVLSDLEAQLRFAPVEALLRDIERTETLAGDIEPDQAYPLSWVVYRITGYRADTPDMLIRGTALLADLSALVERLCVSAKLRSEAIEGEPFLTIEELEARWRVSRSTINRHRKRGLVARRVRESDGKDRLVFGERVVERHEQAQATSLGRAAGYSRIGEEEHRRVLERARALASEGLGLNEAAARIAESMSRSHEGIRQVLRRHDAAADSPIFEEPGQLTARERRFIARAGARAIEPSEIASHLGRSDEAVRRAIDGNRARMLVQIDRTGALEVSESVSARLRDECWVASVLESREAREGLDESIPRDLLELIEWARGLEAPDDAQVRGRLLAEQALRARAAAVIRGLDSSSPRSGAIDRAETDLRWAILLKSQLVRAQMGRVIAAAEEAVGSPVDRLRRTEAFDVVRASIGTASVALDAHDPITGGAVAAPLALGVSSALSRRARAPQSGRATPKVGAGAMLPGWVEMTSPRLSALACDPRLSRGASSLEEEGRRLLEERFGLGGSAPSTLEEIAERRGVQPMHVARRLRRAWREALSASRE